MRPISRLPGHPAAQSPSRPAQDPQNPQDLAARDDLSQRAAPISARRRFPGGQPVPAGPGDLPPRQPRLQRVPRISQPSVSGSAAAAAEPVPSPERLAAQAFDAGVEQWRQQAIQQAPGLPTFLDYSRRGKDQAVNDVADRIRNAAASRAAELSIDMLPAAELPAAIGQLTHLTHLSVRSTECARLPDTIRNLSNLQELALFGNHALTRLPDSLADLHGLQTLMAHLTPLRTLPHNIGSLSSLTMLSLSGGTYEALPPSFTSLPSLKTLEILRSQPEKAPPGAPAAGRRQGLQELPGGLGRLQTLEQLVISDHLQLATVPDSLGDLSGLQELTLSKCPRLRALPDRLGRLHNLAKLDLSDNTGLTTLPERLGRLRDLQELNLSGNSGLLYLPELAPVEGRLARLSKLNLAGCSKLRALPYGLPRLSGLKELNLEGCSGLSAVTTRQLDTLLPAGCKVTLPSGVLHTTTAPPAPPQPQLPTAAAPANWAAPPRVDPTLPDQWQRRLAPFAADDTNGRFAQWLQAVVSMGLTESNARNMDRIIDAAAASAPFRHKLFDFAATHLDLRRDLDGVTMAHVQPGTLATVPSAYALLLTHLFSTEPALDAAPARNLITEAIRERFGDFGGEAALRYLAGDKPPIEPPPPGSRPHGTKPWEPLVAYVKRYDRDAMDIVEGMSDAQSKLDDQVMSQAADEESTPPGADAMAPQAQAAGPSAVPAPDRSIDEGMYHEMSRLLAHSTDLALHDRYVNVALALWHESRASSSGR
jgi:hypothetical protein